MTAYQRLPAAPYSPVPMRDEAARPDQTPTASIDLAWIDERGSAVWDTRTMPDIPEIDGAVASLGRGAMLQGSRGPIAIEDLMPGDRVATQDGGTAQIDWIGSRSYGSQGERPMFFRVAANAFGAQGPQGDVMLGALAHILIDSRHCLPLVGKTQAFAPIAAFEDGHSVTAVVPPGEVSVYGLACAGQEAILIDGLPVESYHPSRATARSLNRSVLAELARLFPQTSSGAGFGAPRIPYLSFAEAQGLAISGR